MDFLKETRWKALPFSPLRRAVEASTVTQQVSADLRTFRSNISSKRGKEDVTLWTLYQALKLLERHAILNQM